MEKSVASCLRPSRQLIIPVRQLSSNFRNTGNLANPILLRQPIPKCRTEIEPVMKTFGLNETFYQ